MRIFDCQRIKNFYIVFLVCFSQVLFLSHAAITSDSGVNKHEESGGYNVVVISVNALRADHLGCYGYSRSTSPNIDAFARNSVIFDRAISQSYWTLPSLVSLFTSQYVCAHNVDSRGAKLEEKTKTLAEVLKMYGYATAGFTCGLDTSAAYGLNKGFDVYSVYGGSKVVGSISSILPKAVKWLDRNKDKKFFLFLQSYDVHPPYRNCAKGRFSRGYEGILKRLPLDYTMLKNIDGSTLHFKGRQIKLNAEDMGYIIGRYDDCIEYVDGYIGTLLAALEQLKLSAKTIVILCADHGEELGERGTFNRFGNQNLYQEVLRVPLLIQHPAIKEKGRRISALAEMVDIMPTILELLRIPPGHELQGKSLVRLIRGGTNTSVHRYAISEASKNKWMILGDDGWKLVYSPQRSQLYNLNADPQESHNLIGENADVQVSLMKELFFWRERHKKETADNYLKLDPELIEKLRRAGYW